MIVPLVLSALLAIDVPLWRQGPAQVPDAVNTFLAADDVTGPIHKGVLLCRIDVVNNRGWDTFGAVDLGVTFTIGKGTPSWVRGPDDQSSAVVSVPAVDLAPGEKLHLLIEDRDVTENELIARGHALYQGKMPLRINLQDVEVECRAIDRATAELRARPFFVKANAALPRIDRAVPDLTSSAVGKPHDAHRAVASEIDAAAAWLGDDDPAVRASYAALEAAMEAFHDRSRALVREVAKTLPLAEAVPIAHIGVVARVIPGPGPSLVLEVRVPSTSPAVTVRDADVANTVVLLDPTATPIERHVFVLPGREAHGVTLEPGATAKIRLRTLGEALPQVARIGGVLVRLR